MERCPVVVLEPHLAAVEPIAAAKNRGGAAGVGPAAQDSPGTSGQLRDAPARPSSALFAVLAAPRVHCWLFRFAIGVVVAAVVARGLVAVGLVAAAALGVDEHELVGLGERA